MNLRKNMRRGSLAALITLALTSSALAMPTGGEVVRGAGDITLSGGTWDSVANNATITATNDGQINWQAFNIANGETLNFNIDHNKTLVNNVTGSQLSDILGTMNQTGGGNLVLVNPNGIHIGGNAVLNVSDMTLSALGIIKANDTERVLRQNGEAPITIDGNAKFNVSNQLDIFGGKVSVADGVVFNMGVAHGTNEPLLQIKAANSAAWTLKDGEDLTEELVHNAGNDVVFNGTVKMLGGNRREVEIGGAKVSATGAKFLGENSETTLYAASKFNADERDADDTKHVFTADVAAANKISLDGVTAEGKSLQLGGGVIDIKNSTAGVYRLGVEAVASYRATGNGAVMDDTSAPDRTINITGSTLKANQGMIYGGKITVADDATIEMKSNATNEAEVLMAAGNRFMRKHGNDHGDELRTYRGVQGNHVDFHGTVKHEDSGKASFGIGGYTVNADRAKLHGDRTEFALTAFTKEDYDQTAPRWQDYWETTERSAANTVQTDGLEVRGDKELYIDGGSVTLQNSDIKIGALTLVADQKEKGDGDTDVGNLVHGYKKAGTDNVVYLSNVKVHRPTVDNGYDTTTIYGGKVNIEKSDIEARGRTLIGTGAEQKYTYGSQSAYLDEATADNVLSIKDSTFRFDRSKEYHASFGGGKAIFDGVTMTRNKEINLFVGNKMDEQNGGGTKFEVTKDNEFGLWNSTVEADEINISAGKIGVWKDSKIAAGNILAVNSAAHVTRTDGSTASLERDASSHVTLAGTESAAFTVKSADQPAPPAPEPPAPPVPTPKPEQPKPVPTPELSKDDKENMASGKKAVEEALSKNATQENRIAALTDVVADLNANASRRQSAGVVVGIVQEIATSSALSDGEKVALVERVLSAYAPVQEAKAEQDNVATNSVDEAVGAAATVSAAPVYPDETEAEDAITFA